MTDSITVVQWLKNIMFKNLEYKAGRKETANVVRLAKIT